MIAFSFVRKTVFMQNNSFHKLWNLIQDMFNSIKYNYEHFRICKKIFFTTLLIIYENVTKSWDSEMK